MRKNICILLIFILLFTTISGVFADSLHSANKSNKIDKPKVYLIDENGKLKKSDKGIEFFIKLSKEGQATSVNSSNTVIPYSVPIEPGAIKITESVYRSFTNSDVNNAIDILIGTVFGVAWAKYGGLLIKLGLGTTITENLWINSFAATATIKAINRALNWAHAEPTYSEAYQYKTWSDYYNAYMIYQVIIFYEDSNYSNPLEVNYWHVMNEYNEGAGMQ